MASGRVTPSLVALSLLDRHTNIPMTAVLGPAMKREDIRSSMSPFFVFPAYKIAYPEVVISALQELYVEYNRAFIPLIEANREWDTDYQYCIQDGTPVNCAIQIDMAGLPQGFLDMAAGLPPDVVREMLRRRIFEIENSVAVYQLLERIFSSNNQDSFFKSRFRATLNNIRKRLKKPIALLAVTRQKYHAMMESELGKQGGEALSETEVKERLGFDRFFGPEDFQQYVAEHNGRCDYLLYARTSDPIEKLKNPDVKVDHPLLGNPEMRRIIKAHSLTLNIDAPDMDSVRKINDTKEYQSRMNMAFAIHAEADLFSLECAEHLFKGKSYEDFSGINRLSDKFMTYLKHQWLDPADVESGRTALRCKPMKCAYGCYGHLVGSLKDSRFRSGLRRNLRQRGGGYVIQPEMNVPRIVNNTDGTEYAYIDRNFFSFTNGRTRFLGGFRTLMPLNSTEAQNSRIHGNSSTVLAEIT